ncbi:hypothetical protein A2U01_0053613, partial [Trifolium medium]|nr:hypothetical protein [Trifolium medium]
MNTSMDFSSISEKMDSMHLWNVASALHRANGIIL